MSHAAHRSRIDRSWGKSCWWGFDARVGSTLLGVLLVMLTCHSRSVITEVISSAPGCAPSSDGSLAQSRDCLVAAPVRPAPANVAAVVRGRRRATPARFGERPRPALRWRCCPTSDGAVSGSRPTHHAGDAARHAREVHGVSGGFSSRTRGLCLARACSGRQVADAVIAARCIGSVLAEDRQSDRHLSPRCPAAMRLTRRRGLTGTSNCFE